jgi:hypothetical protein
MEHQQKSQEQQPQQVEVLCPVLFKDILAKKVSFS